MSFRLPPVVVFGAAAVAQRMVPRRRGFAPASALAAAAIASGSVLLALGGVAEFAHHRTTVDPHHVERAGALVTTGSNAVTRNPMYVGLLGLLVARAVARRRTAALLPAAGFWWVIDHHQVPAEERALAERFGREYEEYCASVPRWL